MKVRAKTYSDMTLVIDGHINADCTVSRSAAITPIKFNGIKTISHIYDQRFRQDKGDTITFTINGLPLTFEYGHGLELWAIADEIFWEYQERVNPEIAELMHRERIRQQIG